jgi:hypothetical protein
MVSETLALIPFGYALAYAIFGGVEFGLPLLAFSRDKRVKAEAGFGTRWESINLLLGLAVASAILLYPEALDPVSNELKWFVVVTAVLLAVRFALIVWNRMSPGESVWIKWVLAGVSLVLPAVMALALVVLLTGDGYLLNHPELALSLGIAAPLLAVAVSGGFFYKSGTVLRTMARRGYLAAGIWTAVTMPLALVLDPTVLEGRNLLEVTWPAMVALGLGLPILMWPGRLRYFVASAVLITGVATVLYRLLSPYALRPFVRLDMASADGYTQIIIVIAFIVSFFFVFPFLEKVMTWATSEREGL